MKIQAIIPMAGTGERLKSDPPKPFIALCGKPVFIHTLEVFEKSLIINSVVVVGHKEKLNELKGLVDQHGLKKVAKVIAGGKTRRESVFNGLKVLESDTDVVFIHDGVRPLVTLKIIEDAVQHCRKWEACVAAVPVKPTIKKISKDNLTVEETLDRKDLWEIQTPQVFKKDLLLKAHNEISDDQVTDDAALVERLGIKVGIFPGDYKNIKITTQEDLLIAEAFLRS